MFTVFAWDYPSTFLHDILSQSLTLNILSFIELLPLSLSIEVLSESTSPRLGFFRFFSSFLSKMTGMDILVIDALELV